MSASEKFAGVMRNLDGYLVVILLTATVISLRAIGDSSLGYPDADRILMDGVFIRDFLAAPDLFGIYEYTTHYFAQYPALSIGYRPPFFPFVEALFNAVFGINMWSSRLALLLFWYVGLAAWYRLVTHITDRSTGFWATMVLATTPFVAKFAWYTMAEVAVLSMAMLTVYVFYRFTETDQRKYLYATAIIFGLTVWTKQTAVLLALWMVMVAVFDGRFVGYLKRRDVWIAFTVIVVIIAPLAAITLWLGDQNIAQSVGTGDKASASSRLNWQNLTRQLNNLRRFHLETPTLALAILGIGWAIARRDRKVLLVFGLLIVAVYMFVTYLVGKNERYPIFWIPPLVFFAVLPAWYLKDRDPKGVVSAVVFVALIAWQLNSLYGKEVNRATGYDEAARFVLENSRSPVVFFDGYNNGYFTYFMRALDPHRSMYVLRGDKLLSSSSIGHASIEVHAESRPDIDKIFDGYGVEYIVIEKNNYTRLDIHQALRDYLREGPFEFVLEIEMEVSNRVPLYGQSLLIYRNPRAQDLKADFLELKLPVVGKTLRVPVRDWQQDRATD